MRAGVLITLCQASVVGQHDQKIMIDRCFVESTAKRTRTVSQVSYPPSVGDWVVGLTCPVTDMVPMMVKRESPAPRRRSDHRPNPCMAPFFGPVIMWRLIQRRTDYGGQTGLTMDTDCDCHGGTESITCPQQ